MGQFCGNYPNNPPSREHVLPNYLATILNRLLEDKLIGLAPHNTFWPSAQDGKEDLGPSDANPIFGFGKWIYLLKKGAELADAHECGRVIDLQRT